MRVQSEDQAHPRGAGPGQGCGHDTHGSLGFGAAPGPGRRFSPWPSRGVERPGAAVRLPQGSLFRLLAGAQAAGGGSGLESFSHRSSHGNRFSENKQRTHGKLAEGSEPTAGHTPKLGPGSFLGNSLIPVPHKGGNVHPRPTLAAPLVPHRARSLGCCHLPSRSRATSLVSHNARAQMTLHASHQHSLGLSSLCTGFFSLIRSLQADAVESTCSMF